MEQVIIDWPILEAICNRLKARAREIYWFLLVNHNKQPLLYNYICKELKLHKHVFYRSCHELEMYGLAYRDSKTCTLGLSLRTPPGIKKHGFGVSPMGQIDGAFDVRRFITE